MNVPACSSEPLTLYTSCLARVLSRDASRLGEILAAVARLNAINRALAEVRAELAALRANKVSTWREERALRLKHSLTAPIGPHKPINTPTLRIAKRRAETDPAQYQEWLNAKGTSVALDVYQPPSKSNFIIDMLGEDVTDEHLEACYQKRSWIIPEDECKGPSFAGLDSLEISYSDNAVLKGDGRTAFRDFRYGVIASKTAPRTSTHNEPTIDEWVAESRRTYRPYRLTVWTFDGYIAHATYRRSLKTIAITAKAQDTVWCATCFDYVPQALNNEQGVAADHICRQQPANAHLEHWFKTATALHAARPLAPDRNANKARRRQEQQQRKAAFDAALAAAGCQNTKIRCACRVHTEHMAVYMASLEDAIQSSEPWASFLGFRPLRGLPIDSMVKCELSLRQRLIAPKTQEQLERLFIHPEADFGADRTVADRGNSAGELIEEGSRQLTDPQDRKSFSSGGGKRVNTAGLPEDDSFNHESLSWGGGRYGDGAKGDRCSRDYRADAIRRARGVSRNNAVCAWPHCGVSFTQVRKGHDYHTPHCRKMHWKELNQGQVVNLPQTQGSNSAMQL